MISSPPCNSLAFFQLSCLYRSCVGYCVNTNMIAITTYTCTHRHLLEEPYRQFRNMAVEFEPLDCCRYLFNDAEVKTFDPCQIAAECFGGVMTVGVSFNWPDTEPVYFHSLATNLTDFYVNLPVSITLRFSCHINLV